MQQKRRILCLMGPTASGKSAIAEQLAVQMGASLISVDSAMVYRGMDIGTAKPDHLVRASVDYHLLDVCDPSVPYSAGQFVGDVQALLSSLSGPIILVGGTQLYYQCLQRGVAALPNADDALRAQIDRWAAVAGWPALHQRLKTIDSDRAEAIHENDKQRIQRALEVYFLTGQPLSVLQADTTPALSDIDWVNVALMPSERVHIHSAIARRFDQMLKQGLMEEVELLYTRDDLHADLPAMRAVGYAQVWAYLSGKIGKDQMYDQALAATRQLAKRQITWLRQYPLTATFDPRLPDVVARITSQIAGY